MAVNGGRTRCADLTLSKANMEPTVSIVLDYAVDREL